MAVEAAGPHAAAGQNPPRMRKTMKAWSSSNFGPAVAASKDSAADSPSGQATSTPSIHLVIATARATKDFNRILSELDERRDVTKHNRSGNNTGIDSLYISREAAPKNPHGDAFLEVKEDCEDLPSLPNVDWGELKGCRGAGAGAYCDVLLAQWRGKPVTVKLLKAEHLMNKMAINDLNREGQLLYRLNDGHVLRSRGSGKVQDRPFVVLQALDSMLTKKLPGPKICTPIWERSRACKLWTPAHAVEAGLQLAKALKYCHGDELPGSSVLHRDLKPDNIGFASDGRLVLFDFGLAKVIPQDATEAASVKMIGEVGSARYMAPEVCLSMPYGTASEMFSWAIIMWQMLSHDRPFQDLHVASHRKLVAVEGMRPKFNKKLPEPLQNLLQECWDQDPAKRPTFAQLVPRLEQVLATLGGQPFTAAKPEASAKATAVKEPAAISAPAKPASTKKMPAKAGAASEPKKVWCTLLHASA